MFLFVKLKSFDFIYIHKAFEMSSWLMSTLNSEYALKCDKNSI